MKSNENMKKNLPYELALLCSRDYPLSVDATPQTVATCIQEALRAVFGSESTIDVKPIEYPASSKMPMEINVNCEAQRLLWFYPQMSMEALADELRDLMSDVPNLRFRIPA